MHFDFVGDLRPVRAVGAIGALRAAERIERCIAGRTLTEARLTIAPHLLRHRLRTLPQLFQRPALLPGGTVEVALLEQALGVFHRFTRAIELAGRWHTILR